MPYNEYEITPKILLKRWQIEYTPEYKITNHSFGDSVFWIPIIDNTLYSFILSLQKNAEKKGGYDGIKFF